MDFRRQIVTCLFSMLRLSFETQKVKENYAIFTKKTLMFNNKLGMFLRNIKVFLQHAVRAVYL